MVSNRVFELAQNRLYLYVYNVNAFIIIWCNMYIPDESGHRSPISVRRPCLANTAVPFLSRALVLGSAFVFQIQIASQRSALAHWPRARSSRRKCIRRVLIPSIFRRAFLILSSVTPSAQTTLLQFHGYCFLFYIIIVNVKYYQTLIIRTDIWLNNSSFN